MRVKRGKIRHDGHRGQRGHRGRPRVQTVFGQPAQVEDGPGHIRRGEPHDPGPPGARDHVQELRGPVAAPGLLFPGLRVGGRGRGRQDLAVAAQGVRVQDDRGLGGPGTGGGRAHDGRGAHTVRHAVRRRAGRPGAGPRVRPLRARGARQEPQELRVRALWAPRARAGRNGRAPRVLGRGYGRAHRRVVGQAARGQADAGTDVARSREPGAAVRDGGRRRGSTGQRGLRARRPLRRVRPLRLRLRPAATVRPVLLLLRRRHRGRHHHHRGRHHHRRRRDVVVVVVVGRERRQQSPGAWALRQQGRGRRAQGGQSRPRRLDDKYREDDGREAVELFPQDFRELRQARLSVRVPCYESPTHIVLCSQKTRFSC